MKRIYVAGPFSNENTIEVFSNMRRGMRKATELLVRGYAPFCPWVDYHYSLMLLADEKIEKKDYWAYSLAFLDVCDAVLLLPNWKTSPGTLREIKRAEQLGIPVFTPEEEGPMYDYFEVLNDPYDPKAEEMIDWVDVKKEF